MEQKILSWFGNSSISPDLMGINFIGDSVRWDYSNYCIELNSKATGSNYVHFQSDVKQSSFRYRVSVSYYAADGNNWGDGLAIGCMCNSTPIKDRLSAWALHYGGYSGFDGAYTTYFNEKKQEDTEAGQLTFFSNGGYINSSIGVGEVNTGIHSQLIFEGISDENGMQCTISNNDGKLINGVCGISKSQITEPFGGRFFFINGINKTYNIVRRIHSIELWSS
jgi:hypothetical protein